MKLQTRPHPYRAPVALALDTLEARGYRVTVWDNGEERGRAEGMDRAALLEELLATDVSQAVMEKPGEPRFSRVTLVFVLGNDMAETVADGLTSGPGASEDFDAVLDALSARFEPC